MTDRPSTQRSQFGRKLGLYGRGEDGAAISMPGVVQGILYVMVAIFLVQLVASDTQNFRIVFFLGLSPQLFVQGLENDVSPWRLMIPLFGHMFVHGNLPHILFNSLWLIVFGTGVGRRLWVETDDLGDRLFNTSLFLTFYLASGVAGAMTFVMFHSDSLMPLVGASGAISGLMAGGMRIAMGRDPRMPVGQGKLSSMFSRPVITASALYIGLNLLTGIGLGLSAGEGLSIAWEAHIGGYVFGLLTFPLFDALARRPIREPSPWIM